MFLVLHHANSFCRFSHYESSARRRHFPLEIQILWKLIKYKFVVYYKRMLVEWLLHVQSRAFRWLLGNAHTTKNIADQTSKCIFLHFEWHWLVYYFIALVYTVFWWVNVDAPIK